MDDGLVDHELFVTLIERGVLAFKCRNGLRALSEDRNVKVDGAGAVLLFVGLGRVEKLIESRHTKTHIFPLETGTVEGVQSHLCCRLTDAGRRHQTHHVSILGLGGLVHSPNLSAEDGDLALVEHHSLERANQSKPSVGGGGLGDLRLHLGRAGVNELGEKIDLLAPKRAGFLIFTDESLPASVRVEPTRKTVGVDKERVIGPASVAQLLRVHPIISVEELDDATVGIADSTVRLHPKVLHLPANAFLDVAGGRRLDGGGNDTDSTTCSVEEDLLWSETLEVAMLNETPSLCRMVSRFVVGQCSRVVGEVGGNPASVNVLLTDKGHNLNQVHQTALRTAVSHDVERVSVALRHAVLGKPQTNVHGRVEDTVDLRLRGLIWLAMALLEDSVDLCLHLGDDP